MTTHEILQKQLEQFYNAIERSEDSRFKIRSWCITVVVGLITIVGTGKLILNDTQVVILVISPIIFFWILESMQVMTKIVDQHKARHIEKLMLLHERELPVVNNSIFFAGSATITPLKTKIRFLLQSAFLTETLILFYIFLSVFAFVIIRVF